MKSCGERQREECIGKETTVSGWGRGVEEMEDPQEGGRGMRMFARERLWKAAGDKELNSRAATLLLGILM